MRGTRFLALAAALAGAAAQPATGTFQITWYEKDACDATGPDAHTTVVWGETDFCHAVPQSDPTTGGENTANPSAGYKVQCFADGTAKISFHNTATCGPDGAIERLVQTGACIANAPGWGSRSFSVECAPANPVGENNVVPGLFLAQWMEFDNCDPTHQTHVLGSTDICHVVPQRQLAGGGATGSAHEGGGGVGTAASPLPLFNAAQLDGYKVTCFADGTGGVVSFSPTYNCADQALGQTTFANGQCLRNPAQYGSRSVRFFCSTPSQQQQQQQQQAGTTHAVIRWFEKPACDTVGVDAHRTVVVARQGFCQRVPDRDAGYRLVCDSNADGTQTGRGTLQFCNADCSACAVTRVLDSNICTANDFALWGSASFSISCLPADLNIVPDVGDAGIRWIESAGCADEATHYTNMLIPQNICHLVPGTAAVATSGYKVTCEASGLAGVFETCNRDCSVCSTRTPFTNGPRGSNTQCLPNPVANTGSASVRFACQEPRTVVSDPGTGGGVSPSPSAGGGGGGGGGNTTTSGSVAIGVSGAVLAAAVGAAAAAVGAAAGVA